MCIRDSGNSVLISYSSIKNRNLLARGEYESDNTMVIQNNFDNDKLMKGSAWDELCSITISWEELCNIFVNTIIIHVNNCKACLLYTSRCV